MADGDLTLITDEGQTLTLGSINTGIVGPKGDKGDTTGAALVDWHNVRDYGATGLGVADDSTAIQNAINAAVNTDFAGIGTTVYFPTGKYYSATGLVCATQQGVTFRGEGMPGESNLAAGNSEIIVGNGQWGLTVGTNGNAYFRSWGIFNLNFFEKNTGQGLGGIQALRANGLLIRDCNIGAFTTGTGILLDGTPDELAYATLDNVNFGPALIGFHQKVSDGTRMIGCYLEGNGMQNTSGSIGIKLESGDTFRGLGVVVQGYDTLVEIGHNLGHEFYGLRCEVWHTQAIHVLGDGNGARNCKVSGYGDNSLNGGIGSGVVIDSGVKDFIDEFEIEPGTIVSNLRHVDNGTRTRFPHGIGAPRAAAVLGSVVGRHAMYDTSGNLLGYVPVYDAITGIAYVGRVQEQKPNTTGVSSLVFTVPAPGIAIGDHVLIGGGYKLTSTSTIACADTGSNTYTVNNHADLTTSGAPHTFIISAPVTTTLNAGDTITVTFGTAVDHPIAYAEHYTGIAASSFVDQAAGATGTGTAPSSGNVTTTADNELLFAVIYCGSAATITAGTGFTTLEGDSDSAERINIETQAANTGTYAATGTLSSGQDWACSLVTFKKA